ncbi:hypothetical protein D3C78_1555630 [compost metagenome]
MALAWHERVRRYPQRRTLALATAIAKPSPTVDKHGHQPPEFYRGTFGRSRSIPPGGTLKATEQADDQGVEQVNEKAAHQRYDEEGLVSRTVLLGHGRHVDDGGRRGAEGNASESRGDHAGFVITAHEAEDHQ